jgi:phosphatidylserine/phosphatidylglycerophosphate/cardiolipin synthase-like enzyme
MRTKALILGALLAAALAPALPAARAASNGEQIRLSVGSHGLAQVMRLLASAQDTLDIEMYHLTDRRVLKALLAAAGRGVRVRIILDPSQRRNLKVPDALEHPGVEVRWMDTDEGRGELLHAKAALVDCKRLLIGSANWTHTGLSVSHEAGLVIEDSALAAEFERAFEQDWSRALLQWPSHGLRDEELLSLPDAASFYEDKPRMHGRRSSGGQE